MAVPQQIVAHLRMLAHHLALVLVQGIGLVQDAAGHGDLAGVMQRRGIIQQLYLRGRPDDFLR